MSEDGFFSRSVPHRIAFPVLFLVAGIAIYFMTRPSLIYSPTSANERNAVGTLKHIALANQDFKDRDLDRNHISDYWTRDVAGLYYFQVTPQAARLRQIELAVAMADAKPAVDKLLPDYPWNPKAGYWFKAIPVSGSADGRNTTRFAFAAFPNTYRGSGRRTFVICEDHQVWKKDLEGAPIDSFPTSPANEGWSRLD